MDPLLGIWSGMARMPWREGDSPQRQRLEDLLDGYTREAAYAEFQEYNKGMLRQGMLADLVLLNADLFAVPPEEIAQVHPVLTMVDGRTVHRVE
jgi:predicted amidohydrolase YtcJ